MTIQEAAVTDDGVKIVRANAAFDCGGRCPLRLHVKDNVIIRVEGDGRGAGPGPAARGHGLIVFFTVLQIPHRQIQA